MSILDLEANDFKYSISVDLSIIGLVFGCIPTDVKPDFAATLNVLSKLSLSSKPGSPVDTP